MTHFGGILVILVDTLNEKDKKDNIIFNLRQKVSIRVKINCILSCNLHGLFVIDEISNMLNVRYGASRKRRGGGVNSIRNKHFS